jgi:hypothetical protein
MRPRALAVAVALLAVLAACASAAPPAVQPSTVATSPTPRPTPRPTPTTDEIVAALERAAATTGETSSVTFELQIDIRGGPGGRRIARGEGQFESGLPPRGWMHLDLGSAGGELDYVFDDLRTWMRADAFERFLGRGKWLVLDTRSTDPRLAEFRELASSSGDAAASYQLLTGAEDDVRIVGREAINAVATTHYAMTTDTEVVLERASAQDEPAIRERIADLRARNLSTVFRTDGWVDDEGFVRRVLYVADNEVEDLEMTITFDFVAFDEEVRLIVPDPGDTISIEDLLPDG